MIDPSIDQSLYILLFCILLDFYASRTQDAEATKSLKCLDLLKLILSGTEWRSAWKMLISEYWSLKGGPIFFL